MWKLISTILTIFALIISGLVAHALNASSQQSRLMKTNAAITSEIQWIKDSLTRIEAKTETIDQRLRNVETGSR